MILAARYDIARPLAQGGFGKTFLACDRHLPGHPHCVIKQLHLAHETPRLLKIAQRLFDLEAETLYRLGTHSQIPTLLAHFKAEGSFYLVQEYVLGQLLQEALEEYRSYLYRFAGTFAGSDRSEASRAYLHAA